MKCRFWRLNGRPSQKEGTLKGNEGRLRDQLNWRGQCGFAVLNVLLAWAGVLIGNTLFSFPPFLLFAIAVMASARYAGLQSGLVALALATLLSDFFFIHPAYELSMNGAVLRLLLVYFLGGLVSYLAARRLASRHSGIVL